MTLFPTFFSIPQGDEPQKQVMVDDPPSISPSNKITRWWFQPFGKILVKFWNLPQIGVKIKKYLKPPARNHLESLEY